MTSMPTVEQEQEQEQGQGLGLGLYIASEIARAHGGTLEVTSSAEGTRFTFGIRRLGLNE
jgi:hypothetical protein